jgi:hypothetical protein
MFAVSSFNTLDSLKDWFYSLNGINYWTIYKGPEKKTSERIMSYSYDSESEGWEKLSQMISNLTLGGGLFTIYAGRNEKDASGFTVRFSSNPAWNQMHPSGPGIAGLPTTESIAAIVEEKIEAYKKDKLIEDLQSEIEDLRKGRGKPSVFQTTINGIGELMENNPTLVQVIQPLIQAIAARMMGVTPQPVMTGTPRKIQTEGISDDAPMEYSEDDITHILDTLNIIAEALDTDPVELLGKLQKFCSANPAMAKSLLSNLG